MAAEYKNTLPKKNKNKFFAGGVLAIPSASKTNRVRTMLRVA